MQTNVVHIIRFLIPILASVAILSGCASGLKVTELRKDIKTVTFVQHGTAPRNMGFGVVDTASWWAAYGADVGLRTGGTLWYALAAAGSSEQALRAPTALEIMKYLYQDHPMATQAVTGIMPELARAWGVPYDGKNLRVIDKDAPLEDKDGYLLAVEANTDLVLVVSLARLELTEKVTVGAALKAGFTLGTGTKDVTAETIMGLSGYRREPATGRYKSVWFVPCWMQNMDMDTAYPFPELVVSREKAKILWDEAVLKMVNKCNTTLQYVGKDS